MKSARSCYAASLRERLIPESESCFRRPSWPATQHHQVLVPGWVGEDADLSSDDLLHRRRDRNAIHRFTGCSTLPPGPPSRPYDEALDK
jgi:hypothetical protein